jgi:hypothetical protein
MHSTNLKGLSHQFEFSLKWHDWKGKNKSWTADGFKFSVMSWFFNKYKWENSTVRKKEQEMLVNVETHQPNAATGYWEPYGKR